MKKKHNSIPVQVRITGEKDATDGFAELFLGMLSMVGALHEAKLFRQTNPDNPASTKVFIELKVSPPPLGHLGEDDLPEYEGNNP